MSRHEAVWSKSTYSDANGGNCVEVALRSPAVVPVRDSKTTPDGPVLHISRAAWTAFISAPPMAP
ncbi:MAG: DUF397 domain-containing protein [Streptomyces sp.]|nr:DUF397 domain-containing protein [Streptomyces sp.]